MHQAMVSELARIKIAEELEYAARQRLARGSSVDRSRTIDMAKVAQTLRVRLFGPRATGNGVAVGGRPAGANA
jgi:hypothetical protein